jgi:hypothetical protein
MTPPNTAILRKQKCKEAIESVASRRFVIDSGDAIVSYYNNLHSKCIFRIVTSVNIFNTTSSKQTAEHIQNIHEICLVEHRWHTIAETLPQDTKRIHRVSTNNPFPIRQPPWGTTTLNSLGNLPVKLPRVPCPVYETDLSICFFCSCKEFHCTRCPDRFFAAY